MATLTKKQKSLVGKVDSTKLYPLDNALALVKEHATAKFDESIDVAVQLGIDAKKSDQVVRGAVVMPNGTGKTKRVAVFAQGAKAEEAKAAGADVVGMEAYAFTDNDMSAQLQKLKNAVADCLICISYGKDGALVLKLMKEMGIDLPVVISSGVMVPAARNLIAPDELAHVNGVMDAYLAPERGPDVAAYIKTFKERFKVDPDPFGSCYYDGAWIMKQVMDKVGTDRTKIRDELRLVKDYKGVTNIFTTDEWGNMVHSLAVF
jgi:ribosomal protein L1